jgi:ribosomal protein S6--L-glutamate ligase
MDDKIFNRILHELAKENGYTATRIIDGVYEFKKGNKKVYIKGKNFGLNTALAAAFAKNKAQTFEILRRNGIKAVPHYELYQPVFYAIFGDQEKRNKMRIKSIIKKEKLPLVIKPAEGSKSIGVSLVRSKRQIVRAAEDLFITEKEVVLCPFRDIKHEYRTVVLNGKVELIYDKIKPERVKHGKLVFGMRPQKIDSTDKVYSKLETIAKRAAKTLGLDFATVDIIETEKEGLEILEVNSNVCLGVFGGRNQEYFDVAKSIYKKAFKKAVK